MKTKLSKEQLKELDELFPFEYVGGGYFRRKDVKKGFSSPMLHGKEAVEFVYKEMRERIDALNEMMEY